jgi:DNA-binding transcriptional MerR regulator
MTSAAPARDARRGEPVMSIGEVLSRLRPEFPDITISKLRFLEAEGLVEPLRAPSGYRKYTQAHLERLRFVLTAQRDRYLPLRVIREQIDAMDRGERVVGLPPTQPEPRGRTPRGGVGEACEPTIRPSGDSRLSRAQLAERSGLDEDGLADLERYGLLVAAPNGDYGGEALMVARVAAQLRGYGIEARHLRPYRTTADREVGLLAQLVPTIARQSGSGGRLQALETVHELAALCAQLHGALVRQGLRQALGA